MKSSLSFVLLFCTLLFASAYLILFSGFVSSALNPILLSASALLIAWLGMRLRLRVELPLGLFLAVLALTTLTSSDPHRSIYQVWLWAAGFSLLYLSASLTQKLFPPLALTDILLLLGAGLMLFSWLDAARWYRAWLALYPGEWIPLISYRLNGGNTIAAYYHGIFALAAVRFWFAKRWIGRGLWALYSLSVLLLLLLASSRGAYVGLIAAFGFLLLLRWRQALAFIKQKLPASRTLRISLALLAGVIVFGILAGGAYWFFGVMSRHPTHGAALSSRSPFWGPALEAFTRAPLLGHGPDTYAGFYMSENSIPPGEIFLHAHNSFLDLLAGSGILGLLAFAWLAGTMILRMASGIQAAERQAQIVRYAGLLALLTFLGHSLFDGLYRMPFAAFNLCLLLGTALGAAQTSTNEKRQWAPLALALLAAGLGWWVFWSSAPYRQGVARANSGDLQSAVESFEKASRRDPWFTLPHQQRALALARLAPGGAPGALEQAIQAFEIAIDLEPSYSPNHANLASLYRASGNLERAETQMLRAAQLAPGWAPYQLNLGEIYEMQGQDEKARESYRSALSLHPELGNAVFWRSSSLRETALRDWLATAPAAEAVPESETEALRSMRAGPILALADQRLQEGRLEDAHRLLSVSSLVFAKDPALSLEREWLWAELAAAQGDYQAAAALGAQTLERCLEWGAYGPGGQGHSLYASGVFHTGVMAEELAPQFTRLLPGKWEGRMVALAGWQAATR